MAELFERVKIAHGVNLYLYNTKKYKTISIRAFLYNKMDEDITKTALIPFVLARGTNRYPDNLTIRRQLASYYGAQMGTGVTRRGDTVLLDFKMEMVSPKFVKDNKFVESAVDILREVIFEPRKEEGFFKQSFVKIEKENTKNKILAILNDKGRYAFERAVQFLCPNDPYRYYKYGRIEDLEKIDEKNLFEKYQEIIKDCPIDLYVVGNFEKEEIIAIMKEKFNYPRENLASINPPIKAVFNSFQEKIEEMEVNQGKLIMGLKTPITLGDKLYPALIMYNGILGAFSHSKLFKNVREKASLAYYAGSNIESLKGLLFVFAGIEPNTYDATVQIIKEQLEDMKKGDISEKEFNYTLASIESGLLETFDEVGGQIGYAVDSGIIGKSLTITKLLEELKRVTIEDVVEAAKTVELELVYFLKGKEGQNAH